MIRKERIELGGLFVCYLFMFGGTSFGQHQHQDNQNAPGAQQHAGESAKPSAPESKPHIPQADAAATNIPVGYEVEIVATNLTYPTSIEFDDRGIMYVAESGYIYGDPVANARILKYSNGREPETLIEGLNGPITDLLWFDHRLFISHRGKISVYDSNGLRDLVAGLPSLGDHHNNQLAVGPDGMIYFGQGTATNSGVVGIDSFNMGWLAKYPEICDIPAKDIRLTGQAFETPNPLVLLSSSNHMKKSDHASHYGMAKKMEANDEKPDGHSEHEMSPQAEPDLTSRSKKSDEQKGGHASHSAQQGPTSAKQESNQKTMPHDHQSSEGESQFDEDQNRKKSGENTGKEQESTSQGHNAHTMDVPAKNPESSHDPNMGDMENESMTTESYAFLPFGKTPPDDGAILGKTKASGTILRMNPDGSDLEVFAWGLRNPFGLVWGMDKELYASDNGYDERGSRPIAHAPDCVWQIKKEAWYGFPDYAGGIPVTDPRFAPEDGPAPKFLMHDHPNVEQPVATLTHHVGAAKMDVSHNEAFGLVGHLFLALSGDMNPITGKHQERSGFEIVSIDPKSFEVTTFFKAKPEFLGPQGSEYVVTAGMRRPVDVRFSPDGQSLFVIDVGAMRIESTATGPTPIPFPNTGVVWKITRTDANTRTIERK